MSPIRGHADQLRAQAMQAHDFENHRRRLRGDVIPIALRQRNENKPIIGDQRLVAFDETDPMSAVVIHEKRLYFFRGLSIDDALFKNHWRARNFYETELLHRIRMYGRIGTYIDVGANLGNHSVFFLRECPSLFLLAIEPVRVVFDALTGNVTRNNLDDKDVAIVNAAAWDDDSTLVSMGSIDPTNVGMTKVVESRRINGGGYSPADVRSITIDSAVANRAPRELSVAVIKIDVEGSELRVLEGARRTIEQHRPIVAVECATDQALAETEVFFNSIGGYVHSERLCATPTYIWAS